MSALAAASRAPDSTCGRAPGAGVWAVCRTEQEKLRAQAAVRVLTLLCLVGPFAFGAVLGLQSGTPSDALFGAWVHASGFALSLVVLGFAGSWGLPLLAGILAGDLFSSEDRHGTWKTVLTRSATRGELFAGKVLAAMSFASVLVGLVAFSSPAAGLLLVGDGSLVDLGGRLHSTAHALLLTLASWLWCVLPTLAYVSLAVLFSVSSRNGIVGVIGPALVALATQLLALIGKGVWVHLLLIGSAFDGWHGLFAAPPFYGPMVVSGVVSLSWIAGCLSASWLILARRDFVGVSVSRRVGWTASARVVGVATALIAVLAVAANLGPVGVTAGRLRAAIAPEFSRVTLLQQQLIGRAVPPGATLAVRPSCNRHGGASEGPGDWSCLLDVYLPQPGAVPFQQAAVTYEVSVQANGCYKAQSPPAFVGQQTMRDIRGRQVVNPLFIVYGCFNPLG